MRSLASAVRPGHSVHYSSAERPPVKRVYSRWFACSQRRFATRKLWSGVLWTCSSYMSIQFPAVLPVVYTICKQKCGVSLHHTMQYTQVYRMNGASMQHVSRVMFHNPQQSMHVLQEGHALYPHAGLYPERRRFGSNPSMQRNRYTYMLLWAIHYMLDCACTHSMAILLHHCIPGLLNVSCIWVYCPCCCSGITLMCMSNTAVLLEIKTQSHVVCHVLQRCY